MSDQVTINNYHTRNVGAYVQFVPGGEKYFLGNCVDLDALPRPRTGGKEYDYCWNDDRNGFVAHNYALSTPGNTEFTLARFIESTASFLERINCPFSVYAVMSLLNPPTTFGNWERIASVHGCDINEDSLTPVTHHVDDNPVMYEASVQAFPNRTDTFRLKVVVSGDPDAVETITAAALYGPENCEDYRFPIYGPGFKRVVAVSSDALNPAVVYYSTDGGVTWTATAANPFGNDIDINAVAWFPVGDNQDRLYAWAAPQIGVAMAAAYSDDGGATWISVTIGNTVNEGPVGFGAYNNQVTYVSSYRQMYVVTSLGGCYFSDDGGAVWNEQTGIRAVATGNALNVVDFSGDYGIITGADPFLFTTTDGENWVDLQARIPAGVSGSGMAGAKIVNDKIFTLFDSGFSTGSIFITWDEGVNWTTKRFTGDTANGVHAVSFYNDYVGMLIVETTGTMFLTVDGGDEWIPIQTIPSAVKLFVKMASTITGLVASGADGMSITQKY